jgi:Flp pilus assembly protein TadG
MTRLQRLRHRVRCDDRGSGAVQFPVMAATYIAFIMLLVFVGRVNSGYSTAEAAARSAARTIAIARDPAAAVDVAREDAATIANVGSAKCRAMDFTPSIDETEVTVTVTCDVDLGEVSIVSVPGTWTATATATEPIDQWRETTATGGSP